MNRITRAVAVMEAQIASKQLTAEKTAQLSTAMDLQFDEYCVFQERKSLAVGGKLTLEEAQTVYAYLGSTPDDFNRQPLAVKVVLTKLFAELLQGVTQ